MSYQAYIDVDKTAIPYDVELELSGEIYQLEFSYNRQFDFFAVDLFKNGVALVMGEKLILNRPLWRNNVDIDIPKVQLIPKDRAGVATRITYENMNETVFLYVMEGDRDAAE